MSKYFTNKKLYVKSLETKNLNIAKRYVRILSHKFDYIRHSISMNIEESLFKGFLSTYIFIYALFFCGNSQDKRL